MKSTTILLAFGLTAASFAPAVAQESTPLPDATAAPVEAPRCGGLLCDMGILGRSSTTLPCHDFLCRAVGGHQADAAPPPPAAPVVAPEPAPAKAKVRKKKRIAKAVPPPASEPSAAKASPQ